MKREIRDNDGSKGSRVDQQICSVLCYPVCKIMTIRATNYSEIRKRGGEICGNDEFEIVRSTCCGHDYMYNHEVLTLYLDPNDLRKRVLNIEGDSTPPCISCGKQDWDFEEIAETDERAKTGTWAWAL